MKRFHYLVLLAMVMSCYNTNTDQSEFQSELQSIDLLRGDIALCGSEEARFGKVEFGLSCKEKVQGYFNLATALLHSFEYAEAEKVFVKVIDEDPGCLMAYWGVAMSNFHPLWAPPTKAELEKGTKTIRLARSLESKTKKETDYLEAVGALYDDWEVLDHSTRIQKFEKAAEKIHLTYPDDREAAIFYALALRAASDPTDKSFVKQRKAGEILSKVFAGKPDHPGVAHYLIHTYDYPELADLALPAARKYASIASASAHALHMPSHIFTRLGLWDESVQSNINSMSAARCYAENAGMATHWDEEVHALDYLVYAYLQQGRDEPARAQLEYLQSMESVSPVSNKNAYTLAAVPTRYALERKNWEEASRLQLLPDNFPWENFPWENSMVHFGRILGAVHLKQLDAARADLAVLKENHENLLAANKAYEANQVKIQMLASEAWIRLAQGDEAEAARLMDEAAAMEDATEKHPVTPGEVIPARELLGDMFYKMGEYVLALEAYEEDLKRHPGRFNGLYGAAMAAKGAGINKRATVYFKKLLQTAQLADRTRPELAQAELFLKGSM